MGEIEVRAAGDRQERGRGAGCRVALSKYQIAGHLVKCCNSNEYLCYESRLIFHLAFWLIEIALTIYMTVCAQVSLCVYVCVPAKLIRN